MEILSLDSFIFFLFKIEPIFSILIGLFFSVGFHFIHCTFYNLFMFLFVIKGRVREGRSDICNTADEAFPTPLAGGFGSLALCALLNELPSDFLCRV